MKNFFRFVIIGSGNICRTYFQAIQKLNDVAIVGLVSRNHNRPDFLSSEVEIASRLNKIQSPFDGVILATPNGLHHEGAISAAKLTKHVLTEKPLDITLSNMDSMISVCNQAGVKLGVTFQHRMSPDNLMLKKLIDDGAFGRIYSADYTVKCWRDQAYYDSGDWRGNWEIDGGGPFIQQACHELDLYSWFFGQPHKVFSLIDTFAHNIEVEDHGAALFHHENGMIGTFIASTVAYPGFPPILTIHTKKGTIIITNGKITSWHIDGLENPCRQTTEAIHSGAASAAVNDTQGHEAILSDFITAVRENRDPAVSGESAREATVLALRIYDKLQATL